MRRLSAPLFVAAVVLLGLTTTGGMRTTAQEATPAAAPNFTVGQLAPIGERFEPLPGVDLEIFTEGEPTAAPGQSLVMYRIVFREGEVPSHIHPGTTIATVESGTFSWTLLEGTVWVTQPRVASPEQVTEPGTELILEPGASLFYNADVVHSARAAGDEPASVLVTVLFETGQPFFTLSDEQGTPTS